MAAYTTIDEYIAQLAPARQPIMQQIRQTIHQAVPWAQERISYGMPSFWQQETLIWFAAAGRHIGIYPTASGIEAFVQRLEAYDTSRGTIRIPWDVPIPFALISDIAAFRLSQAQERHSTQPKR